MEKTGSKPIDEKIRRAIIGDGTAFTALWDTYIDSIRTYIKTLIKNLDDFYVEDICSRSFEKAFRQIGSYDPSKSQFTTWLKTIARNTALDTVDSYNRDQQRYRPVYLDDSHHPAEVVDTIQDQIDTPLDSIIKDEDEQQNLGYIEALPELYREITRKRLVDGLQYKEIAEDLEIELNTVRTRLRRAKSMMEEMKKNAD